MANKQRVAASFARHYSEYETAATVQKDMAARLAAALFAAAPGLNVARALEIGIGTGFLTRRLVARYPQAEWWFNDLTPAAFDWIPAGLRQASTLPGDAETLPYPQQLNLIASASALQWFDNLPAFFAKARSVLAPGGVLAVASFGSQNLCELAQISGNALRCPSLEEWKGMAQEAGLRLMRAEEWLHGLRFPSVFAMLQHLRHTGVNGAASAKLRTMAQLRSFSEAYGAAFAAADGSVPLTYHPLLLIAGAS